MTTRLVALIGQNGSSVTLSKPTYDPGWAWTSPTVIVAIGAGIIAALSLAVAGVSIVLAVRAQRQATFANLAAKEANDIAQDANGIAKRAFALEEARDKVLLVISVADDYLMDEGQMTYRVTVRNLTDRHVPLRRVSVSSSETNQIIDWSEWNPDEHRNTGPKPLAPKSENEFSFDPLIGGYDDKTIQTLDTLVVETQTGERFTAPAERIDTFRRAAMSQKQFDSLLRERQPAAPPQDSER